MSALVAILLIAMGLGLSACGGGSSSDDVVAQVGSTAITKAEVSHWMSTLAGGDFYEISHKHMVPAGLVSEPPNYAACAARLEAAASSLSGRSKPTAAQISSKCRQLYQALRLQTLEFLISSHWLMGLYLEEGLTATDAETTKLLNQIKADQFPEEDLQKYLARRRRSLSDERFIVKLDVLRQKAQRKLEAGGKQALAKFTEAGQRWTAKTNCYAGYVVQHCRQYKGSPTIPATASPAVLLEQVAVITGQPCINQPACG